MPKKKRAIPDRWLDYEALGQRIPGSNFIVFKVPLHENLCNTAKLEEKDWFTPKLLMSKMKENGHHLGMVIDLTNTDRYYNPQEFLNYGIKYNKIFCLGHAIPSVDVKKKFTTLVKNFLRTSAGTDLLIGVHCTHGLNRTGYLVCRYLIENLGFHYKDAITAFNTARGHKIERQNYLNDLKKCYSNASDHNFEQQRNYVPENRINFRSSSASNYDGIQSQWLSKQQYSTNHAELNQFRSTNYASRSTVPGNKFHFELVHSNSQQSFKAPFDTPLVIDHIRGPKLPTYGSSIVIDHIIGPMPTTYDSSNVIDHSRGPKPTIYDNPIVIDHRRYPKPTTNESPIVIDHRRGAKPTIYDSPIVTDHRRYPKPTTNESPIIIDHRRGPKSIIYDNPIVIDHRRGPKPTINESPIVIDHRRGPKPTIYDSPIVIDHRRGPKPTINESPIVINHRRGPKPTIYDNPIVTDHGRGPKPTTYHSPFVTDHRSGSMPNTHIFFDDDGFKLSSNSQKCENFNSLSPVSSKISSSRKYFTQSHKKSKKH